jgi:hypothetical protein
MRADIANADENKKRVAEAVEDESVDAPSEAAVGRTANSGAELDNQAAPESDRR